MNRTTVFERVSKIFKEIFDDNELEISEITNSEEIEDWDSLEHINLIVAMEKEFGIKFDFKEVGTLNNVGEMIDLIVRKL